MKLSVREIAIFGVLGAIMYASKLIMEVLPNMHLLGMFIISLTVVYRRKALYPIYTFVLITGLTNGFNVWWVPYLYIWTILWAGAMALPKKMPPKAATVAYMLLGAAHGCLYGCLYAFFPAGFLSQDDPIVRDTVRLIETGRQSVGGLPIGMGWMRDGLWVAMALGNVARAYLRMGASADPSKYLYPTLNHASPFVTWCEERGAEAGASKISGDRQHLWTPLSVCQYLTEALFHEDGDAVHVCAGIAPEWLSKGKEICVKGFRSHYGKTDFSVKHTDDGYHFSIRTERTIQKEIWVHLPSGIRKYKNETP